MPRARGAAVRVTVGDRRQAITLQNPAAPVADGGGGYTEALAALDPPMVWGEIVTATASDLERRAVGTVIASASHLVTIPFHREVTTETVVTWTDTAQRTHTANVLSLNNTDQRGRELVLVCEEIVP